MFRLVIWQVDVVSFTLAVLLLFFSPHISFALLLLRCVSCIRWFFLSVIRFAERNLRVKSDIPNGDCMLNSVFPHVQDLVHSVSDMRNLLKAAFTSSWNDYSHLFPENLTEESKSALIAQIGTDGEWENETMDLAFHILAKALNIGLRSPIPSRS
jgi:hypothetical protein